MKSSTITISNSHQFNVGDKISIPVLDNRWFVVLWCWIRRKPLKARDKVFVVTYANFTTVDIKPAVMGEK